MVTVNNNESTSYTYVIGLLLDSSNGNSVWQWVSNDFACVEKRKEKTDRQKSKKGDEKRVGDVRWRRN